jgi:hypothetical protein
VSQLHPIKTITPATILRISPLLQAASVGGLVIALASVALFIIRKFKRQLPDISVIGGDDSA